MIEPPEITPALLRALLRYESDTGLLFWRERPRHLFTLDREHRRWNGRYANRPASYKRGNGYLGLFVFRRGLSAHRVAWAVSQGEWPIGDVDHINGVRDDNRISNLRDVTRSENCRNASLSKANKTGATGVTFRRGKWRASMHIHLGLFDTLEEAVAARKEAEERLGYHPNHGRPA